MKTWEKLLEPIGLALVLIGGVTYGILYTSGILALLPLIVGLGIFIASIVIRMRRSRTEGAIRSAKFGISTGLSILFLAAILILAQTLSTRHSFRFDTTKNKRYSLSQQTVKILKSLKRDVNFTCCYKETTRGKIELEDLLKEYSNKSPHIKYQFIDPDKNPVLARRYEITNYGTTVVESGDMEEKVYGTTEEKVTNAILKVTRKKKKVVYFATGHGEKSIDDNEPSGINELGKAIEGENYEVKEIFTMRDSIPEDCQVLVFAGPTKDIFPAEREMVERYLDKGGKVLVLIDPMNELPELIKILNKYGIDATNSVVIDKFGKLLAGNYLTPVVNNYGEHAITKNFRVASFFPQARALKKVEDVDSSVDVEILASTSSSSYAETNIDTLIAGKTQFRPGEDISGPVHIALVASKSAGSSSNGDSEKRPTSRLVVFGDSDFASNAYMKLSGNSDLILNTINWLAEEEDLIAIRPKSSLTQPVILTSQQGRVVFWLPVVGLPALIAVIGIIVVVRRYRAA